MYVKPSPGLRVIDPVCNQFMPEEGMAVDDNDLYWIRRVRDHDVVQVPHPDTVTSTDTHSDDDHEPTASDKKKVK